MSYLNFGKHGWLTPQEAAYFDEDFDGVESQQDVDFVNNVGDITPPHTTLLEDATDSIQKHRASCSEDNALGIQTKSTDFDVVYQDDQCVDVHALLGWLPRGWIVEIRIRTNEMKGRRRYKCYIDPATRFRFYSKVDISHYLESGEACNCTYEWELDEFDMIVSRIEYAPEGFPHGWIKEVKFRLNASGMRKDPYYTDLVSGYVFRSKKDVFHFVETGKLRKHATKPKDAKVISRLIKTREAPPPTTARSLSVKPSEIELNKHQSDPLLQSQVDNMFTGADLVEETELLLTSCEHAGLEILSMTLENHPKEEHFVAERSNMICSEINCVHTHDMPTKNPENKQTVLDQESAVTSCNANGKLSETNKLEQLKSADDLCVQLNCVTGVDASHQGVALVRRELRQENIRKLKYVARGLAHLLKVKPRKLNLPSDRHVQKMALQKAEKYKMYLEKQFLTGDKSVKVHNEKQLEPEHACLSNLEKETSKMWNQWEFLATTANNLANIRPSRLYQKLAIRKPSHKIANISENKGMLSNEPLTNIMVNSSNSHSSDIVPKLPFRPVDLSISLKEINDLPSHAAAKSPSESHMVTTSEVLNQKPPLQKFAIADVGLLSQIADESADIDQLPAIEIFPRKPAVEYFTNTVPLSNSEYFEATICKASKAPHSWCSNSQLRLAVKLPSPVMAVGTSSYTKPGDMLHKSVEMVQLQLEHMKEQLLSNLEMVITCPSDAFTEVAKDNLLECIKEELPPLGLEGILPATKQEKEAILTERQLQLQNVDSVAANILNQWELIENNTSKASMEVLSLPSVVEDSSFSEVLHESTNQNLTVVAAEETSPMRTASALSSSDAMISFNSESLPTQQNNVQEHPCLFVNDTTYKISDYQLVDTVKHKSEEELPPEIALEDKTLHGMMIQDQPNPLPSNKSFNISSRSKKKKLKPDCEEASFIFENCKTEDGKALKFQIILPLDEANIIQVPTRTRSPLTRSKTKVLCRTSPRFASNQPVKPIITYKRKRRRPNTK